MNYRIVSISLLASSLFVHANVVRAQTTEAPVLPMEIKFHYGLQYFEQSFRDDPRYARIAALIDGESCDIILLDKTTNRGAFYSGMKRKVDALAANGVDAYTTAIDVTNSSTADSHPVFRFHFRDEAGQEITWQFVAGEIVTHALPEVIAHADNSGVGVLYAPRRAAAASGTILTIAERKYQPIAQSSSNDAPNAFYATDMTITQILPGTDLWYVESSPADAGQTAKWALTGNAGRQRVLALKQISPTEAEVYQIDGNDPDAPHVVFNVVRVNGAYEVRSLSFDTHFNKLWIFFGPSLPLPTHQSLQKRTVTFTIAQNEQATVASGELDVQGTLDAERAQWRFKASPSVRGASFETGVTLLPGAHQQASCAEKDCSDLR